MLHHNNATIYIDNINMNQRFQPSNGGLIWSRQTFSLPKGPDKGILKTEAAHDLLWPEALYLLIYLELQ